MLCDPWNAFGYCDETSEERWSETKMHFKHTNHLNVLEVDIEKNDKLSVKSYEIKLVSIDQDPDDIVAVNAFLY